MLLSDFDYDLPEERIAQVPIEPRNASRLMVLDPVEKTIEHRHFYDLKEYLEPGDTLIFNDTRVMPARLIGHRDQTGGKVEVFLLRRLDANHWETLVKPGKKAKPGNVIRFGAELSCTVTEHTDFGGRIVEFHYDGIFEEILDRLGETPLPPYIHEKLEDKERYQTVYNREEGSAAAPTAGLHFTKEQMQELREMGVNLGFVTLHVGLGTFRPVSVDNIEEHEMHKEYYCIPDETAKLIMETKKAGHRVIAVGTTSRHRQKRDRRQERLDRHLHLPRLRLQDRRRHHHQLPPAKIHPHHAHQRLRRPQLHPQRLQDSRRTEVSLLLLRRRHVHPAPPAPRRAHGRAKRARSPRPQARGRSGEGHEKRRMTCAYKRIKEKETAVVQSLFLLCSIRNLSLPCDIIRYIIKTI